MKFSEYSLEEKASWVIAVAIPLFYAFRYAPYGMDTTDFGFFYGYPWRILQGEVPFRDFFYINPALPLYWHSIWLGLAPESWQVLFGKLTLLIELLAASWFGALFLARLFDFKKLSLPTALLATTGFVWGTHSFPPMPWHTADGVFFGSAGLYAAIAGWPFLAGIFAAASMFTKQSFLLLPLGTAIAVFFLRPRKIEAVKCLVGSCAVWGLVWALLNYAGAWEAFRELTTKQLNVKEALEAGIYIYLRQEWWLPLTALIPWAVWRVVLKESAPSLLHPFILYFFILCVRYVLKVLEVKSWLGYGESWPTLLVVLGGVCVLLPRVFVAPWLSSPSSAPPCSLAASSASGSPMPCGLGDCLRGSVGFGALLLLSWSVGISGGYKIPAFFAVPLVFTAALIEVRLFDAPQRDKAASLTLWTALVTGVIMFGVGYQYPYVFPQRSMSRASLVHDAGLIFKKADGVYVDEKMFGTLRDLRDLRAKYGPNYRVLPGMPMAYYLTGDKPVFPSEWVMDWWINDKVDDLYNLLVKRDIVVFFEKDQLDVVLPDAYERSRYSVPQKVRHNWRIVDETEHFVVFRRPEPDLR